MEGREGGYIHDVNWLHIWRAYIQGVLIYKGHINEILRYFHLEQKLFFLRRQFNKNRHCCMFKVKILDSLKRLTGCNWSITENKIHVITVFLCWKSFHGQLAVSWNQICENATMFYGNIVLSVLWRLWGNFVLLKIIVKKSTTGMDIKHWHHPILKELKLAPHSFSF